MFRTLKQSLDESPVGMAIVDTPRKQIVRRTDADGSYRVMWANSDGEVVGQERDYLYLDKANRHFALRNINCRPVIE
jgi:hypothetical protein